MAKSDKKKKDKKGSGVDAVEVVRDRGKEIVDEVARAVTRVRQSFEEHGVIDELRNLRTEVEALARRVGELEGEVRKATAPKPTRSRTRSPAAKSPASTAAKPAGTARTTRARTSGAAKSSSAAAKPSGSSS
jgi:hypothetical protein